MWRTERAYHTTNDFACTNAFGNAMEACVDEVAEIALTSDAFRHDGALRTAVDKRFQRHTVDRDGNVEHDDASEPDRIVLHGVLVVLVDLLLSQHGFNASLIVGVERVGL